MGPFGRTAVSLIVNKDVAKKKENTGKEGNKNRKGSDGSKSPRGTEDGVAFPFKKDTTCRRGATRLFSWSRDDSGSHEGGRERKERGRRISAPGKVQSVADTKMEQSSILDSEFGVALSLNRIKTRSGPLYTASTRSGPVFAGTFQSRFDVGNDKRDAFAVQSISKGSLSSRSLGVQKAAKVHARDSVSPKDTTTEEGSSKGRSSVDAESLEMPSSTGTEGSPYSPFVGVSRMNSGRGKMPEGSLSESCVFVQDSMSLSECVQKESSSGQVSQTESTSSWVDVDSNFDSGSVGGQSMRGSPMVFAHGISLPAGSLSFQPEVLKDPTTRRWHPEVDGEGIRSSDVAIQESENPSSQVDVPKETESPRFQALLRMTGGPRKGNKDIKSFSHELDPRGVRSHEFLRPQSLHDLDEVMAALVARFNTAKEEVNAELAVFAGVLVDNLEKHPDTEPDWQERTEDLLVLARDCAYMDPEKFRKQCEAIVQELDDKRQELPMGVLKQLHTRMLFILTRCTRLVQFERDHGFDEDGPLHRLHCAKVGSSLENYWASVTSLKGKAVIDEPNEPRRPSPPPKFHDQEATSKSSLQQGKDEATTSKESCYPQPLEIEKDSSVQQDPTGFMSPVKALVVNRLASWKNFSSAIKEGKEPQGGSTDAVQFQADLRVKLHKHGSVHAVVEDGRATTRHSKETESLTSLKRGQRVSWGHWGDQPGVLDENLDVICRICEDEVSTSHLEDHSRVCALADRCDQQGLGVEERLQRLAETLEKMVDFFTPKSSIVAAGGSPDTAKTSSSVSGGDSSDGGLSERCGPSSEKFTVTEKIGGEFLRRGSEEMLEDLHEIDTASIVDEGRGFNGIIYKTRFGPKVEHYAAPPSSSAGIVLAPASSAGSLTPRSPLATPRTSQIDLLLADRSNFTEADDPVQINELADIARCIANTNAGDVGAAEYLISCLQDLQDVLRNNKVVALTVDTFGRRIEKLCMEKHHQVIEVLDFDTASSTAEEEVVEDDVFKSTPVHPSYKDRTTIDDFEIIKPISRGAFGRVCLARKRTTGDLFAIKVLRKVDMIRKNAVESVQAERNILISARNPFVVRFFYSFTCRDNLYLVMEYLNGGDLYSMLRNLGCLEEDMARVYVAELVLALEYLHSLGVVHRDLKPDNILIAHDGHIKLTDFGLSRVGLINSTDDLSGPAASGNRLMEEAAKALHSPESSQQRERRQQRSAVGTPDYLAPEILLGTSHGRAADWWSTGVILFEFLTGIPPFNAEHPQIIFDNILNRNVPWPAVPEYMSYEAQDLIDKFLTEDPNERLGAKGAAEVKAHPFFKNINWDTLARQKAAFIPSPDNAHDTSYFASRFTWNSSEGRFMTDPTFGDSSDNNSTSSGSTSDSEARPEEAVMRMPAEAKDILLDTYKYKVERDEFGDMKDFGGTPCCKYSFSNFSFKNLSQLASINYDLLQQTERKDAPEGPC